MGWVLRVWRLGMLENTTPAVLDILLAICLSYCHDLERLVGMSQAKILGIESVYLHVLRTKERIGARSCIDRV